jgi:hypothetical protein
VVKFSEVKDSKPVVVIGVLAKSNNGKMIRITETTQDAYEGQVLLVTSIAKGAVNGVMMVMNMTDGGAPDDNRRHHRNSGK